MNTEQILKDLSKDDLLKLKSAIDEKLDSYLKIYIRVVIKQGADYLYATWQQDGTTRQKSLGRYLAKAEIWQKYAVDRPEEWHYRLSEKQAEKLEAQGRYGDVGRHYLSSDEFEACYGVRASEDALDRDTGINYHRQKFEAALAKYEDGLKIMEWADYGISNLKAVTFINRMKAEGHEIIWKLQ